MIILDICISIFEFYVFASFFKYIFSRKAEYFIIKKRWFVIMAFACSIFIAGVVIIRHLARASPAAIVLFTFVFLLCLSCRYNAEIKERIFYSCVLVLLGIGSELFVGFCCVCCLNSVLTTTTAIDGCYIFGMVCSKIIFFLLSRIVSLFYRKEKKAIPLMYWIILALVPIVSIFELYAVVLYTADTSLAFYSWTNPVIAGILLINILICVIYDIVSYQYEKMIIREREAINFENARKRYNVLIQHGQELAAISHDTEKHWKTIGGLIESENYDACLGYLKKLGVQYNQSLEREKILPGNQAASIILDTKIKEAAAYGIETGCEISIVYKIPVDDTDLCVIFGNAFDNAIRACNQYSGDKKTIKLEIHQTYNRLSIIIQNTSNPVIIGENGLCKTTRKDADRHGYGLRNIQDIVKSLNGNMKLIYEDNLFTLKILLFL